MDAEPRAAGRRLRATPLGHARSTGGWAMALLGPPALTVLLLQLRDVLGLPTDLLLFFTLVVLTALVGGLAPAVVAALLGSSLLNYFFTEPTGGLRIDDPEQALALVLFTLVAVAVASVVHVAERTRMRAARARELEQGNAVRTALLSAASHDLRTPLAATRAAVDGLRAPGTLDPEDHGALLATIDVSTTRLEGLIANLLDLSMLHTGAVRPDVRPVSLDEVVLPALAELGGDVVVSADVPEDLPLVLTDPGLLERVVANLVANAVRFSPDGRPAEVRAAVAPGAEGDVVVVSVLDHGPGVAEADRERMFEAFQRLDDAPSRDHGPQRPRGLGLGLAVAHGLSDAVGARLRTRETRGGGLTVEVVVPVAPRPPTSAESAAL